MMIKEKVMEAKVKVKDWCKKHERDIRDVKYYLLGTAAATVGAYIGVKYDDYKKLKHLRSVGVDLEKYKYDVYMLAPDPEHGCEHTSLLMAEVGDYERNFK